MKKTLLALTIGLLLIPIAAEFAAAQDLHPTRRPSPMSLARAFVGDAYVSITYSRPYERGRDNIFGTEESEALVPYGKVWRTGANEATQLTVTGDVHFGGEPLPAGTYSLFTTPGADEWKIHVNSAVGLSGTMFYDTETEEWSQGYKPENDILTVTAKPAELEEKVEQFTISFEKVDDGQHLILRWIDTEVRVPITPAK